MSANHTKGSTPGPESPSTVPGRIEWAGLLALMAAYVALFLGCYPPLSGIEDEVGFVNQALVWSRGAISAEGAGYPDLADFTEVNGRHVAARHPGRSLVALPFLMAGGVRATFLSGMLLHLAMTAAAAILLQRLGRSPLGAVLLLFHPTLALYSRTIMADAAAGTGLLLAALAVASCSTWAGAYAGAAVALAATMRYHAALALPIVAASFLVAGRRHRALALASQCLLAAAAGGGLIVLYNYHVYGSYNEPFTGRRGVFGLRFAAPNAFFYATALLAIWPGMLLAPCLDRSRIRWLVRGTCYLYLSFLTLYYFHDRGSSWVETAVVGQRLLEIALPLWGVSYAGMVDARIARPIQVLVGRRVGIGLTTLACLGLVAATGLLFARHQRHLTTLLEARQTVASRVPGGSLVLYDGSLAKLVGIPTESPSYRLRELTFEGRPATDPRRLEEEVRDERRPWYLAVLHRSPGVPIGDYARSIIERHRLEPVPTGSKILELYIHPAQPGRSEPDATALR